MVGLSGCDKKWKTLNLILGKVWESRVLFPKLVLKKKMICFRAPDTAPLKSKMIYASSKDAIKKKFTGESP